MFGKEKVSMYNEYVELLYLNMCYSVYSLKSARLYRSSSALKGARVTD